MTTRPSITAWPAAAQKVRFAALAARRGLSESKLLGLMIDSVLGSNPVDQVAEARHREQAGWITSVFDYVRGTARVCVFAPRRAA